MVNFLVVEFDVDPMERKWSNCVTCHCDQYVNDWPSGASARISNMRYGRISVSSNGTVKYANNREDNKGGPEHCKGTVIFSAPLQNVKDVGIDLTNGPSKINFRG